MATIETNDQDFDRDVLEASKAKPVVVDWVGSVVWSL